jgi:hypothetical protein
MGDRKRYIWDPWRGSKADKDVGDKLGRQTTSTSLHRISDKQLKAWLRRARAHGGVYQPPKWGRYFTVANLSAELARRRKNDPM